MLKAALSTTLKKSPAAPAWVADSAALAVGQKRLLQEGAVATAAGASEQRCPTTDADERG